MNFLPTTHYPLRTSKGQMLIEAIVAMGILTVAVFAIFSLLSRSISLKPRARPGAGGMEGMRREYPALDPAPTTVPPRWKDRLGGNLPWRLPADLQRFKRLNVKAGCAWNMKSHSFFVGMPIVFFTYTDATFAFDDVNDFGRIGIESD